MARVLAKSGLKVKIESAGRIEPDTTVYSEGVLIPKPEYDSIEYTPTSPYRGSDKKIQIDDFSRLPIEIPSFLTDNISDTEIFLKACGLKKEDILDGSSNVIGYKFTPETQNDTKISYDIITARQKYQGNGGVASLNLSAEIGSRIESKFSLNGSLYGVVEKASGESDFDIPFATTPSFVLFDSATAYTEDGNEIDISSISFELGAEMKQIKGTMSDEFYISDIKPTITIKSRNSSATKIGYAEFLSGADVSSEAVFKNSAGDIKWKLIVAKAIVDETPDLSDDDGLFVTQKKYRCASTNGDDNFSLEYYI